MELEVLDEITVLDDPIDELIERGGETMARSGNPDPYAARIAKKRRGKPGDMQTLLKVVWGAICEAEQVLLSLEGDNPELCLKVVHALSQAAGTYARLLEIGEYEARITALEAAEKERHR